MAFPPCYNKINKGGNAKTKGECDELDRDIENFKIKKVSF